MSNYDWWRNFAASWGTLYSAAIFFAALAYTLWPSNKAGYDEAAQIPLKDD